MSLTLDFELAVTTSFKESLPFSLFFESTTYME